MSNHTFIRTEKKLGPGLSLTFQSFVSGPDVEGEHCELRQIEELFNIELESFTRTNYSGMWDEDDFPDDPEERKVLLQKQEEEDRQWNDLTEFNKLVAFLISAIETKQLKDSLVKHEYDWWNGYFDLPDEGQGNRDYFINDLGIINSFLRDRANQGDTKMAFYSS